MITATTMTSAAPKWPANVADAYAACGSAAQDRLAQIRTLIFRVADEEPAIGPLTETLKWGQPSYLTEKTKSGTTLRLGASDETVSLFVHCQSHVAEQWRAQYGDTLDIIDNRELRLSATGPFPEDPVRHCIAMALTYHARKKSSP